MCCTCSDRPLQSLVKHNRLPSNSTGQDNLGWRQKQEKAKEQLAGVTGAQCIGNQRSTLNKSRCISLPLTSRTHCCCVHLRSNHSRGQSAKLYVPLEINMHHSCIFSFIIHNCLDTDLARQLSFCSKSSLGNIRLNSSHISSPQHAAPNDSG